MPSSGGYLVVPATVGPADIVAGTTGQDLVALGGVTQWANAYEATIFGNGLDGAVTFDGTTAVLGMTPTAGVYTMFRDIACTNITITGASTQIATSGYRIYCTGILDISAANLPAGTIRWRTAANMNGGDASGATAGAAPTAIPNAALTTVSVGLVGQAGKSGSTGVGITGTNSGGGGNWYGYNTETGRGGGGGISGVPTGAGGFGNGGVPSNVINNNGGTLGTRVMALFPEIAKNNAITGGAGGASGGSGGGDGVNSGGGTGGSGSAAGMVYIAAKTIARGSNATVGLISALGGNGGLSSAGTGGSAGGGGGSGGGSGGLVIITCWNRTGNTITNAVDVTGGTGSAGGNGVTTGAGGASGWSGCAGRYFFTELSTGASIVTVNQPAVTGNAASGSTGGAATPATTVRGDL